MKIIHCLLEQLKKRNIFQEIFFTTAIASLIATVNNELFSSFPINFVLNVSN